MKILVADDDRTSRLVMRSMLLNSGYEVEMAEDGTSALAAMLRLSSPRLALLDWMMPGLNGPELCQALRRQSDRAYAYVILLTSRDSKDDLVAGLQSGADDYLTKPCYPDELRARLRTGVRILELQDSLIQARDEMHFRATHDALTHLLNRGAAVHALSRALAEREEHMAVVLGDVDHFKCINDTHGHPVGDEVLREVSRRLEQAVLATSAANTDAVGRFGGEEFLLVLRDTDLRRMAERAETVRAAIAMTPFTTSAGPLNVSMSLGALEIEPGGEHAVDDTLRKADLLLYEAKRSGRNRVVSGVETAAEEPLATAA